MSRDFTVVAELRGPNDEDDDANNDGPSKLGKREGVQYDPEMGQFFAYTETLEQAETLAADILNQYPYCNWLSINNLDTGFDRRIMPEPEPEPDTVYQVVITVGTIKVEADMLLAGMRSVMPDIDAEVTSCNAPE